MKQNEPKQVTVSRNDNLSNFSKWWRIKTTVFVMLVGGGVGEGGGVSERES